MLRVKLPNGQDIQMEVARALQGHVGQANAVNRWALVTKIFGPGADYPHTDKNRYDRAIRKAIESLRAGGMIVCNLGDGLGWFLPETGEEYWAFRAVYGAHAFPIMENIQAMDRTAKQTWKNALQPGLL